MVLNLGSGGAGGVKVASGSYHGDGKSLTNTIEIGFQPKFFALSANSEKRRNNQHVIYTGQKKELVNTNEYTEWVVTETGITINATGDKSNFHDCFNSDVEFVWFAIG